MGNIIIVVIAVIILLTLFGVLIKIKAKKKKQKIMLVQAEDKIREEALDKIILNEKAPQAEGDLFSAKPFEVNYDVSGVERFPEKNSFQKEKGRVMVQIVENSELSSRKYMFDPAKGIYIGSKKGKNDIVVSDLDIDDQQCEIVLNTSKVYIRNIGSSRKVVLKRGKQQVYVEKKYVEIKTNDIVLIGKTLFRLELVKTGTK